MINHGQLKIASFILIFALAIAAPQYGASGLTGSRLIKAEFSGLTIKVDGLTILTKDAGGGTVYPFVYNGRTYLPVRAVSNALGCGVSWDETAQTVNVASAGGGSPSYGAPPIKKNSELISVAYSNISIKLDGVKLDLGADEPFIYNGSVYVPFRAIATALGRTVGFDDAKFTVLITKAASPDITGATGAYGATGASGVADAPAPSGPYAAADPAIQASVQPPPSAPPTTGPPPSANLSPTTGPPPSANLSPSVSTPPAAGPQSPSPPPPAPKGSFDAADLAIVVGSNVFRPGQNISAAVSALGGGYEYEEAVSCAYSGIDASGKEKKDKKYSYKNISFSTLPIDGDLISEIDVEGIDVKTSSATLDIQTSKGVQIGATKAQIEAAYGDDHTYDADFGELIYWLGDKNSPKTPRLYFHIAKSGLADYISVYDGKSAG